MSLARKIIAFPLTLIVLGGLWLTGIAVAVGQGWNLIDLPHNTPLNTMGAVLVALATIAGYKAFKRWVERKPDGELALAGAAQELAIGLAGGALLFAVAAGVVALLGGLEVLGLRGTGQLWSMLGMAIFSGTFEEVLFHGILQRQLERLTGTWIALTVTAALFGAAHIFNPGATWFAAGAIAVEAGLMLGACYLLTRRLWLAIGAHAAWNFTQGWVFSIPVSGGDAPLGLLITRRVGPDWLTGGGFGLEASVVALVVATAAGVALLVMARTKGHFVPPAWRQPSAAPAAASAAPAAASPE